MLRRCALVLALLAAWPAWAAQEWYDHYLEARDKLIPARQYTDAIAELQAAIRAR